MTTSNRDLFNAFILYVLRRKSPFSYIVRGGVSIIVAALGAGLLFNVVLPWAGGSIDIGFNTSQGLPLWLIVAAMVVGLIMIVVGGALELKRYLDEKARTDRKVVLAIEGRGLRDGPGQPLTEAVPDQLEGRRQSYALDLRLNIEDGVVVMPEYVLPRVVDLNRGVTQALRDVDRRDARIVYGGMTSVPFTFLTGVFLDDEDNITIMDWDRVAGRWRELDDEDDGKRFTVTGLEHAIGDTVVIAISTSYPVVDANLAKTFPGLPAVRMDLEDAGQDAHWSAVKQEGLSKQFLELLNRMEGNGVKQIHLVLSAQNSVAFRFGRIYDKRNLPAVSVYQFEHNTEPPYPWSVAMPVSGRKSPEVIYTTVNAAEQ